MTPIALSERTLGTLTVPVPAYDRRTPVPRILHVGVGSFHRVAFTTAARRLAGSGPLGAVAAILRSSDSPV